MPKNPHNIKKIIKESLGELEWMKKTHVDLIKLGSVFMDNEGERFVIDSISPNELTIKSLDFPKDKVDYTIKKKWRKEDWLKLIDDGDIRWSHNKDLNESKDDWDWAKNTQPSNLDFNFDGKEYWVDVSKIDREGRRKIVNYIKKTVPDYEDFEGDLFGHISRGSYKGIIIHCGSDRTYFKPEENLLCSADSSHQDDYEIDNPYSDISKSIYIDGQEILDYLSVVGDEEELEESLEWSDKDTPFDEKDKSYESDPSWKNDEDWSLNPERSYWKQGDAGGSGGGDMNESDDLDWIKDVKPSWLKVGQKFTTSHDLSTHRRYEPKDKVQVGSMTFEIYDINNKHGEPHLRFTHNDVMDSRNWESKKEMELSQNYGGIKFTQAKHNIDTGFWIPLTNCEFIESTSPQLVGKTNSDGSPYGHTYCKPITSYSVNIHESDDLDWIKDVNADPLTASPDVFFRSDDDMYYTLDQLGHETTNMTEMAMTELAINYGYRWSEEHEGWYHRDEVADFKRGLDESDDFDWAKESNPIQCKDLKGCYFTHVDPRKFMIDAVGAKLPKGYDRDDLKVRYTWWDSHINDFDWNQMNCDTFIHRVKLGNYRLHDKNGNFIEPRDLAYTDNTFDDDERKEIWEQDDMQWIKDVPNTIPPRERRNKIDLKDFMVDVMKDDVDLLHFFVGEDTIGPTTEYMRTGNGGEGFTPEDWDDFGYDVWVNDGDWVDNHRWREDPEIWQSEVRDSMELTDDIWKMIKWDTVDYNLERGTHTDRMVFKRKSDGYYFALDFSGSHYGGIDDWDEELYQVFPKEVTEFIYESNKLKENESDDFDWARDILPTMTPCEAYHILKPGDEIIIDEIDNWEDNPNQGEFDGEEKTHYNVKAKVLALDKCSNIHTKNDSNDNTILVSIESGHYYGFDEMWSREFTGDLPSKCHYENCMFLFCGDKTIIKRVGPSLNESDELNWVREIKPTWSTYYEALLNEIKELPNNIEGVTLKMLDPIWMKLSTTNKLLINEPDKNIYVDFYRIESLFVRIMTLADGRTKNPEGINFRNKQPIYNSTKLTLITYINGLISQLIQLNESKDDDWDWARNTTPMEHQNPKDWVGRSFGYGPKIIDEMSYAEVNRGDANEYYEIIAVDVRGNLSLVKKHPLYGENHDSVTSVNSLIDYISNGRWVWL